MKVKAFELRNHSINLFDFNKLMAYYNPSIGMDAEKIGKELIELIRTKFTDVIGKGTCIRFKAPEQVHNGLLNSGILTTYYDGYIYIAPTLSFKEKQLQEFRKAIMELKH